MVEANEGCRHCKLIRFVRMSGGTFCVNALEAEEVRKRVKESQENFPKSVRTHEQSVKNCDHQTEFCPI